MARRPSLAEWFQTDHHEHRIDAATMAAAFEAAAHGDHPSLSAPLASLVVACMRASGDRVALSALGPSELLAAHADARLAWLWRAGCLRTARGALRAATRVAARFRPFGRAATIASFLGDDDLVSGAHLAAYGLLAPGTVARMLTPEALAHAQASFDPYDALGRFAYDPPGPPTLIPPRTPGVVFEMARAGIACGVMMSDALCAQEAATVGFGLAFRAPYLDHRLLEWARALAPLGGADASMPAAVLRAVVPQQFRRRLPSTPRPPLAAWMRTELRPLVESYLFADDSQRMFVPVALHDLWTRFLAGRVPWRPVWAVAVLRAWLEAHHGRLRAGGVAAKSLHRRDAA